MIKFELKLPNGSKTVLEGYFINANEVRSHPEGIVYTLRPNSCKVLNYDYNDIIKGARANWSLSKDKKLIIGKINDGDFVAIVKSLHMIEDQLKDIIDDMRKTKQYKNNI